MPQAVGFIVASYAALSPIAQALVQLAAGTVLSVASSALAPRPGQPALIRDMARPDSLPPYRFGYGRRRIYGTPAPYLVKGGILYGCLILNSRPSEGGEIEIALDKRPVTLAGNIFDFDGDGATGTEDAFDDDVTRFWLGLGNQTKPPKRILDEAGDIFESTDKWKNVTVLWVRFKAGSNKTRASRWPHVPPDVEVTADWTKGWDPRDPDSDPDDPSTWVFLRNRTLVVLDALMRNPVRPYALDQIDLQSFIDSARYDAERVALKAGGDEQRYKVDGALVFDGPELSDLIEPIVRAGASSLTRIGGKIGITPGVWTAPVMTIADFVGDDISFEVWKPGQDLATTIAARYTSADRSYEAAALVPYEVPGAVDEDGEERAQDLDLTWITSPSQAARVQKITALRNRAQRRVTGTLPPSALRLVPGSVVSLALPAPYTPMNGTYVVTAIAPVAEVNGDGVALRCPAEMVEIRSSDFAWVPAEDEQDIVDGVAVVADDVPLSPPGSPLLSNEPLDTGSTVIPRILVRWDKSPSTRTVSYSVQYRIGTDPWESTADVDADDEDADGRGFTYISPVTAGEDYEVRVQALGAGAVSDWVSATITAA